MGLTDLLSEEFRLRLERMRLNAQRGITHLKQGVHQTHQRGAGMEFSGHRAYSPGDDIRYLDWAALGRLDQLVLKEFELYGSLNAVLMLDCSRSMNYGNPNKFDLARQIVAALGYVALSSQDSVQLVPLNSRAEISRVYSGKKDLSAFLEATNLMCPEESDAQVSDLAQLNFKQQTAYIVVTDFLQRHQLSPILSHAQSVMTTCLYTLAPQELHPDFDGAVSMHFREGSERVRMRVDAGLVERYQEELLKRRKAVASECRRHGASLLELVTQLSVEQVVQELVMRKVVRVGQA